MTTSAATITYRKTRDGEWVAYGPAAAIRTNTYVEVTQKSGQTKREYIERIGRPFTAGGQQMRYGYIGEDPEAAFAEAEQLLAQPLPTTTPSRATSRATCDNCGKPARRLYWANDLSGLRGRVCGTCYGDRGSLSFC